VKKKELLLEYKVKFDQSGTMISEDIICTSKNIPIQLNKFKINLLKIFIFNKNELRN
jgi:hypothetical protein